MASEESKGATSTEFKLSWTPAVVDSDVASVSNFGEFQVPFYDLKLRVDFEERKLHGSVRMRVVANPGSRVNVGTKLHLDVKGLVVQKVVDDAGVELPFTVEDFTGFGKDLVVDTSSWAARQTSEREFGVTVTYYSTPESASVCFLRPSQTADKKYPYLFTQGQACLNRQFFPCQDTPAVRCTYTAMVAVAKPFTVVMAANMLNEVDDSGKVVPREVEGYDGLGCFFFEMPQSIPVYLVAMAVGDLRCAPIGPRSRVWSEPSVIEAATKEFQGITEKYLAAGETLFGKYHWDVYDLLVMPPCFPYGGMENPRLTFVTPCLLAGDQSLGDVVAHEIAHSWFGNLVTNASWNEFFLNEGFTMYAQRRITTAVHGEAFTALEADIGINLLKEEIDAEGHDSPLTKLQTPLAKGVDPDDTYNQTPYEKGYCLLSYLRSLVGSDEKFDAFMRDWSQDHKFVSVTAEMMFEFFFSKFPELRDTVLTKEPSKKTWLTVPGMPKYVPDFSAASELTDPANALVAKWLSDDDAVRAEAAATDVSSLHVYTQVYFLDKLVLLDTGAISPEQLEVMNKAYNYGASQNAELRMRWSQFCIKQDWAPGFDTVRQFLESQGKIRYSVPIYRMLYNGSDAAKALATSTLDATRDALHLSTLGLIERIMRGEK